MPSTSTPKLVTAPLALSENHSSGSAIFSVQPGIPLLDALTRVSCFLGSAKQMAAEMAEKVGDEASWAPVYLIEMSQAIIDAAVLSKNDAGSVFGGNSNGDAA